MTEMTQTKVELPSQLPFRMTPEPHESGWGFLLRVCHELGFVGTKGLTNMAGFGIDSLRTESSIQRLAKLIRMDDGKVLHEHFYAIDRGSGKRAQRRFLGFAISHQYLLTGAKRVCPFCLRSETVAWAAWDLQFVAACPYHHRLLIDTCPNCGNKIVSQRRAVHLCKCGFDLRKADAIHAPVGVVRLVRKIYMAIGRSSVPESPSAESYTGHVEDLELPDLLRLIHFFGGRFLGNDRRLRQGIRGNVELSTAIAALEITDQILLDWPASFHRLLAATHQAYSESDLSRRRVAGAFGRLFGFLYVELKGAQFNFLRDAFEVFLSTNWNGLPIKHSRWLSEIVQRSSSWISTGEAEIESAGLVSSRMIRKLVVSGKLPGYIGEKEGGGAGFVWVDRQAFMLWLDQRQIWMGTTEARNRLGLDKPVILSLRKDGVFTNKYGDVPGHLYGWNFLREEIEKIAQRLLISDANLVPCPIWGENVALGRAIKEFLGYGVGLANVLKRVAEGILTPIGRAGQYPGILDAVFKHSHLTPYYPKLNNPTGEELISAGVAARLLGIPSGFVNELRLRGYLSSLDGHRNGEIRLYRLEGVREFKAKYVFSNEIARQTGETGTRIIRKLASKGIASILIEMTLRTVVQRMYLFERSEICDIGY